MAQNIDGLQIEIQSDATNATKGLDNLAKSLEKLRTAVGGSSETVQGLKAVSSALKSLGKIDNLNLTANITQLKKLGSVIGSMQSTDFAKFQSNVNIVSDGVTRLSNLPTGNISVVSKGVRDLIRAYSQVGQLNLDFGPQLNAVSTAFSGISATSANLNNVDFTRFQSNILQLSTTLQPLQGFRTQASSLLNALRSFPETAAALNNFTDFSGFAAQVQTLANSLTPLSNVNSRLGATLDAMSRVSQVSNSLSSVNFNNFSAQVTSLTGALTPLQEVNSRLGSTLNNLSRLGTVAQELNTTMNSTSLAGDINRLVTALSGLNAIERSNLGSIVNQLRSIPNITRSLDPATLDQFAAAVQRLTQILGPLATQMDSVSRGFSALPTRMRSAITASSQMEAANQRTSRSFNTMSASVTRSITKFTVLYFAFRRVWSALAAAFNESNEYIENVNLFTVTMGDATDAAMEFAERVQDVMGIDVSEWIQNQGIFMRLATGFGIAADQAEVMSQNLTQLGYDMASFFNTDVDTAMKKLQSGMTGQIKGLKAFGINISVAALQETALALGIDQSVRSMTEAQKAQLRYITILQRSNGIMGDMGRTLVTPANALRILGSQLTQLKRALGDIISVLATQVIPWVQAFVNIMTDAAKSLADLLGFKPPEIDYSNLDLASDVIDEMGDGLDDTADKAKELKRQLMGFDELNILKNKDDEAKGASYDLGIELPSYDFLGDIETASAEIEQRLKTLLPLVAAVYVAFAAIKFGPALFNGFKTVSNLLGSLTGQTTVLTASAMKLSSALKFAGPIAVIAVMIARFADLYNSSEKFRTGVERIGDIVGGAFTVVKDILGGVLGIFKDIGLAVLDLLPEDAKNAILDGIKVIGDAAKSLDLDWKDLGITIAGIALLFVPGGQLLGAALLGFEALTIGIRALGGVSDETWTNIKTGASDMWDNIKTKASGVVGGIGELFVGLAKGVAGFMFGQLTGDWAAAWDGLSTIAQSTLDFIGSATETLFGVNVANVVRDWFTENVKPWFSIEKWKELGADAVSALLEGLKSLGSQISGWAEGIFDNLKRGFNGLSFNIPAIGGNSVGGMRIAGFADGGFPVSGEMFYARENGVPELVGRIGSKTAVANNDQITQGIASAVYEAMMAAHEDGGSGSSGGTARIIVQIGERAVGEASVEYINGQIRQTGTSPINY